MSHRSVLYIVSIILFTLSTFTRLPAQGPQFLDQGWTAQQRQQFYTTSQGSQMMPLDWFLSLERADSEEPFAGDGLARFGYLPNPKSASNPNGLPVGFTEDDYAGKWVGMTCAACHTNQVEYHGTTLQLDGGPTNADLYAFLSQLSAAIEATLADNAKFSRFAAKVGAKDEKGLRNEVTRFAAYFSTFVNAGTPQYPWGPARADAFGMIFNRVSAVDLSDLVVWQWFHGLEQNNRTPNAPVSYPYLWGVSRLDKVQWNGVAPNTNAALRLERNVVEVLGVFARINLNKPVTGNLNPGYISTVAVSNQLKLEETLISKLKYPQWPETILGKLNQEKVSQGKVLYVKYCRTCHAVMERNATSQVPVKMVPLGDIGTDPLMAQNVACRKANTGALAGSKQPPLIGKTLQPIDYVVNVAVDAGIGAIEGAPFAPKTQAVSIRATAASAGTKTAPAPKPVVPRSQLRPWTPATSRTLKLSIESESECQTDLEAYIGRPLDGIWASAPYLHNGSVPSLYQLLLPASQRLPKFKVGSRSFDPVNVGFDITTGSFDFDTAVPGNSNKGHEGKVAGFDYGTELSEEQRMQLLEYLKSL